MSGKRNSKTIGVLPFSDLSANSDQRHLCDGIAEELINGLDRLEGLRVASRSSSFRFRHSELDAREIGRRLQVDSVLEGSARRLGDRLQVTVQLVDVGDGDDLWSQRFDRPMVDVFEIREEIVASIMAALRLTLAPGARKILGKAGTRVADAYDFYLRGRQFFYVYTRRGIELALEMYSRAIDLDPSYAPAWAGLADCCSFLYANTERDPKQLERALEAAARALTEDSQLAEAHVARAVALSYTDRAAEAQREFTTALGLDPRSFEATYFYARHCFTQDRMDSAIRLYERAARLRPDDYQALLLLAQNQEDLGHAPDAERARRRGLRRVEERLENSPDDCRALYMGANALVALGEIERGLEWANRARQLEPEEPMVLYNLACIYSMAGKPDEAISCLEKSLPHGAAYQEWSRRDSNLDPLRQDPRFKHLMAEVAARRGVG
jgi:TolB-like protein/Flp pilus assembly protein TadD